MKIGEYLKQNHSKNEAISRGVRAWHERKRQQQSTMNNSVEL